MKLLSSGGHGCIITKTPHYLRQKIKGEQVSSFHSGQIGYTQLIRLLQQEGCDNIRCYPVTVSVPLISFSLLNMLVFRCISRLSMSKYISWLTESYMVTFTKK